MEAGELRRQVAYTCSTDEYSLSSPGSMRTAWARMRMALEPMSQKKRLRGLAMMRRGMPTTKRAMYSVFWVMTWLPTVTGSGPVRQRAERATATAARLTELVDGGKAAREQADDDEEERVGEAAVSWIDRARKLTEPRPPG
jgi:hypothetical protein